MRHNTSNKLNIVNLFQRYHQLIVVGLLVLIFIGGVYILRPRNEQNNNSQIISEQNDRITNLEKTIIQLAEKLNQLTDQNNQIAQNINTGKIAGVSTAKSQTNAAPVTVNAQSTPPQGKININTADLAQLDSLSGIGPTYAQRIIDYRNSNGGFKLIDEIKNVKGIGDKTFEKFKDQISI